MDSLIQKMAAGEELDATDLNSATSMILDETTTDESKADFLAALADKGETAAEIAGFAGEFLTRAVEPELDRSSSGKPLLDVCGTGGDKLNLFNVSTTSVFILAAAGVAVIKHGNRGITSKSGGADALEALGIRINLPADDFGRCVEEVGAGFLFAPLYHPAFKAVVPVRKLLAERGQRTIFNILGPLLNPAKPDYQLVGVFDGSFGSTYADILQKLGRKRAWAVHGSAGDAGGMDELSTLGESSIWETRNGTRDEFSFDPATLGLARPDLQELTGGEATENAAIITGILNGSITGPKRDLVTLNSAAGLVITGLAADFTAGLELAREQINSGAATAVLKKWQSFH
ncbi:MAG: anthranilate phosphoribosyltransferase [Verrucomicrobiales bacterium]|nr:anthranilate phosphoribosyltransferase [Verrucomicrobiales bacterium]